MSTQKHIIEIGPPKYQEINERMTFRNFTCPVCGGQGGFSERVGHDAYRATACDYCDGTGRVKAEVLIKWGADYGE